MAKLLEFLDRHTARNLFRSSHLNCRKYKVHVIVSVYNVVFFIVEL